jgi:hypothetical protein
MTKNPASAVFCRLRTRAEPDGRGEAARQQQRQRAPITLTEATALVLGRFRQNHVRAIPILLASAERNRTRFGSESGLHEPNFFRK